MRKNLYWMIGASALAASALVGCDVEEDCETAADCDGYACEIADGEETGTCFSECTSNAECNTAGGFICNEGACEAAGEPTTCESNDDCGAGLVCEMGECVASVACTDGSECAEGQQCTDGVCETIPADPYTFIGVTSEVAPGNDDLNNTNPGPDVDAVGLTADGAEFFADSVTPVQGGIGDDDNAASNAQAATGAPDQVPSSAGECDLDSSLYWAMGDNTGFGVWSFSGANEITDGSTITVYEVGDDFCTNASERADQYKVFINTSATAATAADMRSTWCEQGTSSATGGVLNAQVSLATCGM